MIRDVNRKQLIEITGLQTNGGYESHRNMTGFDFGNSVGDETKKKVVLSTAHL